MIAIPLVGFRVLYAVKPITNHTLPWGVYNGGVVNVVLCFTFRLSRTCLASQGNTSIEYGAGIRRDYAGAGSIRHAG